MSHTERRTAFAKVREPNEDPEGTYLEDEDEEEVEHKESVEDYDELLAEDDGDYQELSFD